MRVLVTGAGGLIGSESCRFFLEKGYNVLGIDNNLRKYFFGETGDTTKNIDAIQKDYGNKRFNNYSIDLRERQDVLNFFKKWGPFDAIIHTAAQPSHDWAAREPFTDFDINAGATLNLLEAFRQYSPKGKFIFTSTNKVYGDNPNKVSLVERETRYDYAKKQTMKGVSLEGISEEMSLDHCKHSIFGASKVAADVMCQEYGRYFGLNVGIFRGGCLTGPQHAAVELHGFLAYIVDCALKKKPYKIFGYKGKQVRDQIHSFDVVNAFWHFIQNPKQGEAYNLGGGKENSASILEVINILDKDFGLKLNYSYVDRNRIGDHICYYSDMKKFRKDFPNWNITKNLKEIIEEIIERKK
jgi:CDP-paratose 2-epimerase